MNGPSRHAGFLRLTQPNIIRSAFCVSVFAACIFFLPAMGRIGAPFLQLAVVIFCGGMLIYTSWHVSADRIWRLVGASLLGFVVGYGLALPWLGWERTGGQGIGVACVAMLLLAIPKSASPTTG